MRHPPTHTYPPLLVHPTQRHPSPPPPNPPFCFTLHFIILSALSAKPKKVSETRSPSVLVWKTLIKFWPSLSSEYKMGHRVTCDMTKETLETEAMTLFFWNLFFSFFFNGKLQTDNKDSKDDDVYHTLTKGTPQKCAPVSSMTDTNANEHPNIPKSSQTQWTILPAATWQQYVYIHKRA